ncbi:MAG: outer membrane protein assembly factor BamB family protein [Pirellulaceae bacterium]
MKRRFPRVLLMVMCLVTAQVWAGDWPQFRYDAGRTAASPHDLPTDLQLRWTRTLPVPQPAFPHELRLAYDASYEPVVLGRMMFIPSMVTDSVTALDTETGEERWRFFAEGPVRFAPVAWEGRIYFVSDDGHLYCVDAEDGSLRWKFRGLPERMPDRKVVGHGRLVSLWPARGGPVLAEGVVYFAAGLWPTEGVFVHAVDAESGKAVWSNTDSNHIPMSNWDHGVGQHAGLTPQGYLAIVGDRLVVPCGAQLPAFFDLETGKLHPYTMGWGGRNGLPKGCWFVAGVGNYLSHGGDLFDIARPNNEQFLETKPDVLDYKPMLYPGGWTRLDIERANQRELDSFRQPVMTSEAIYDSDRRIVARDLKEVALQAISPADLPAHRSEDPYPDTFGGTLRQLWELPSTLDVHIKAGSRLYVAGAGVVEAIDASSQEPKVLWHAEFDGTPHRLLAADEKLFIVTAEGKILAFAAPQPVEAIAHTLSHTATPAADRWNETADAVLKATGVRDGYALVLGVDRGRLIEELARQSNLLLIAVDEDAAKVAALRNQLYLAGLYGTRVSVLVGNPVTYPFSPYVASLVVSETPNALARAGEPSLARAVFHTLRPYGGVACAWGSLADRSRIEEIVHDESLAGATVREVGDFVLLARSGSLPGAADWSHAEANAECAGASADEFIRSPMAVLWFDAAQRWHKYPGQVEVRVAGGRLVIFEEGVLRASDVYTGRELWEVEVPLSATPRRDPQARDAVRYARHRQWGPPASLVPTTQLVVIEDAIYLSEGTRCLVLDPATGEPTGHIDLPADLETPWANLRICDDYLVGSSGPHLLCVHRGTGALAWRVEVARDAMSVALGGEKVFCAELADPRRGEDQSRDGSMFALNIATGERVWQKPGGARLRYSPSLDIVVTPMGFFRGSDGEPLLQQSDPPRADFVVKGRGLPEPAQPGFIAGSKLLTGDEETLLVYDMRSGEPIGEPLKWVRRGCTGTRASTYLLTTRYRANSAWIDLDSREITPLLGVRPGCSVNNNLYPANGVLNMPNLTAGCTCNYAPVSAACVPAGVVERGGARP